MYTFLILIDHNVLCFVCLCQKVYTNKLRCHIISYKRLAKSILYDFYRIYDESSKAFDCVGVGNIFIVSRQKNYKHCFTMCMNIK